ncbi:MAG: ABC transporter ATP-binding protein [Actinomycetota bacterium]
MSSVDPVVARCRELVRTYWTETGPVQALRGIDADFEAAQVTAVMGPSGSGKSSLLRVLAGLDPPTGGSVVVDGRDITALKPRELRAVRRSLVGYVFQRPSDNFVTYLTVDQHLQMARSNGARPSEVLERLGIAERAGHLPEELSGGEQQRAAFAQALVAGTRVIVADEPTAELDEESASILLRMVRELSAKGVAFVIATHDKHVAAVADRVIEIDHGVVKPDFSAPAPRRSFVAPANVSRRESRVIPRPSLLLPERPSPASGPVPLLCATSIVKTYRRGPEVVHAVDEVSLELHSGHLVALMGRSGSGKTTLLNLVAGWEEPEKGSVAWNELLVTPSRPPKWAHLAAVPQRLGLIDELSVRRNVQYPARLAGRLDELRARVEELLERLGLDQLAERPPAETSLGQQQRTALARALVLRPTLFLADEPTGHQDAGWTRDIFNLLHEESAAGMTGLIATHNEDVTPSVDRVVRMADGRVVES